jgi:hypothetical protein
MAGLTKAQRAEREAAKAKEQQAQLEMLQKLAKGEITVEDVAKALKPENAPRVITVERVKDKEGKATPKVKIKGIYAKFPITLYARHILKLEDEGHWDAAVKIAREIVAEEDAAAETPVADLDAPPEVTEEKAA